MMPALAAHLEVVLVLLGVEQLMAMGAADPHVIRHPMTGVIGAVGQGHVLRATAEDLFHVCSTITSAWSWSVPTIPYTAGPPPRVIASSSHVKHEAVLLVKVELTPRQIGDGNRSVQLGEARPRPVDQLADRSSSGAPLALLVRRGLKEGAFQGLDHLQHRDVARAVCQRTPPRSAAVAVHQSGVAQGRDLLFQEPFGDLLARGDVTCRQAPPCAALLLDSHIDQCEQTVFGLLGEFHRTAPLSGAVAHPATCLGPLPLGSTCRRSAQEEM